MTDNNPVITWDRPMMQRLQARYDLAVKNKEDRFTFEGHEFVTDYAKYLLQYLGDKL